jgi:predicted nucleotidyltransferase
MTDMNQNIQPTDARDVIQHLTQAFGKLPQVLAVVLGGSRAAATSDVASDYDLYVYTVWEVPVDFRRTLLGESAEIDNRFWEPGDEWSDPSTGTHIDIMYRSPEWIEGQIERILWRHEAIPPVFGTTLTRDVGIRDCRIVVAWRIPKGSGERW